MYEAFLSGSAAGLLFFGLFITMGGLPNHIKQVLIPYLGKDDTNLI